MPDAEIEANIQTVVEAVCAHRKPVLGPFINRAVMMVVPGETFFPIQVDAFTPKPTEEEIEKVGICRQAPGYHEYVMGRIQGELTPECVMSSAPSMSYMCSHTLRAVRYAYSYTC